MNGKNNDVHRQALKAKKNLMAKGRFYMFQSPGGSFRVFPRQAPCDKDECDKGRLRTVMGFKFLPKSGRLKVCFMCIDCGARSMEVVYEKGEHAQLHRDYGVWSDRLTYKK